MTEHREDGAARRLARDLEALRAVTARDLPAPGDTERALRERARLEPREDWWMKSMRSMRRRPWLTSLATAGGLAAVMLVVPISYMRTTGQEVTLTLPGNQDAATTRKVAGELMKAVGAKEVRLAQDDEAPGGATVIHVVSPSRSHSAVAARAEVFARELAARGVAAQAAVTPIRERVSTSVYAAAADRVVELTIDRSKKNPDEIAADIRGQLEAAGFQNPEVQVTRNGDETKVQIQAHGDSTQMKGGDEFRINLNAKGDGGAPLKTQLHRFEVKRTPGMTDADVKADIERQMREAGVEGTVTVENGKIEIKAEKQEKR